MKHFLTKCTVGETTAVGEGSGKKSSKKACAEKMLEEIRKLPPLPVDSMPTPRQPSGRSNGRGRKRSVPVASSAKKKPRNLIKDVPRSSDDGVVVEDEVTNPISRLLRIQQARRQKDPVYTIIEERGQQRRKEFVMEVVVNDERAEGLGPNKKMAKRVAAENMMLKLGLLKPSEATEGEKVAALLAASAERQKKRLARKGNKEGREKKDNKENKENKENKDSDIKPDLEVEKRTNVGGSIGRQLVPGLILMKTTDDKGLLICCNIFCIHSD